MGDPLAQPETMIRRVYAYVAYRIGDGPDAEDVTSEVFVRALRYRDSYDAAKGQPITWLTGIARTVLIENGRAAADARRGRAASARRAVPGRGAHR